MAIIIKVQVQSGTANNQFKRMNDNAEKLKKNIQAINQKLKATVDLSGSAADNFERMAAALGSMKGGVRIPKVPGVSGGGGGRGGSTRIPKTTGQKIQDLFMRSRIDSKGNLMPLIMDIAKILGPEATIAMGAALTAGKVFAMVLNDASDALQSYRNTLVMGGGTAGQARAVGRLSEFTGTDVGGIGRNLMNGYGPIAAAGAGVNPFGGPFGDMDYNKKGLKVLDYIRNAKSFNQARQRAEMAGAPEAASVWLLNQGTYNNLSSTATGSASESNIKGQAEMQANLAILKDAFTQVEIAIGGPVIKEMAGAVSGLAKVFDLVNQAGDAIGPAIQGIENLIPGLNTLIKLLQLLGMIGGGDNSHETAINKNTDAVDKNTQAIKEGTFGGGPRAASAIPSKMNPLNPSGYQVKGGVL